MRYKKYFIFILFMAFLGSAATLWAFSEPTANPPGNNVRPPINQTDIRQDKSDIGGAGGELGVKNLILGAGSPPEGDIKDIDELVGYNDLILRGSPGNATSGNANPIYIEGNPVVINNDFPNASVGIGVIPNPSFKLDIKGVTRLGSLAADPAPASSAPGAMYYNTALGKFRCYQGAAWTDCGSGAGGGGLTGTGLPGQVTFWSSATALAGSNNLFWNNATSRLGIGTNNPGIAKTYVSNPGTGVGLYIGNGTPFGQAKLELDGPAATHIWVAEAGARVFSVTSGGGGYFAGNLGVGDPTPATKLDVTGDINSTGVYRVDGIAGVSGPVTCAAGFTPNNITINGGIVTAAGACTAIGGGGGLTGTGLAGQVTFWNSATNLVGDSNLFWDTTNNRLGIGDATPVATLTVGAGDLFQVTSTGLVRTPNGSFTTPTYSFVGDTNSGMYSGGADILRLVTAGVDRMTVNAAGKVGIGTISPDSRSDVKLDVAGNIIAGVKIPLLGTDAANKDYVDAQLGQPQTKIVKQDKAPGPGINTIDCGIGYVIDHCSWARDTGTDKIIAERIFQGRTEIYDSCFDSQTCGVCPWVGLGAQTYSYPDADTVFIAECIRQ